MSIILSTMINVLQFILPISHLHGIILLTFGLLLLYNMWKKRTSIYLLDFVCYKPPDSQRVPLSMFYEHVSLDGKFDDASVQFQIKMLEKSGYGHETCVPPSLTRIPMLKSLSLAREEAETVIFSIVRELFEKNNINPKMIDILITNTSMYCPSPSMSSMIINKFGLRSNIMSFSLSGMGCSAGIISIGLARDLLRVHRNSLALIVSSEMLSLSWYKGKKRSMLLTNCLFRMGGVATLMSNRNQDKNIAKYVLQHLVRTTKSHNDQSYQCVFQDADSDGHTGVSLSRDILNIAGDTLKENIASLGPLVLPYSEQIRYGASIICRKIPILRKKIRTYMPDFHKAFEHFCIHAGGRGVIQAIEKSLRLRKEDVEASKMCLYRFGNTSSSSIWYELSYLEAKRRVKRGNRVWQIAFGSGFKCNSAVWKCVSDMGTEIENAWTDRIHLYPVDVPDITKID